MKKLLLLLSAVGAIFTACMSGGGLDNEENGGTPSTPKIELSQKTIDVGYEAATYSVSVTSPYSWKAESDNDWIIVESKTGIAGIEELSFKVEFNEKEKERKGTILLTNSTYNLAAELYVIQKPISITINPESLAFAVEGGTQEIAITANFEYAYSANADWLTIEKSEKGISVTAQNNVEVDERTAEITISSEKYGVILKNITVTQSQPQTLFPCAKHATYAINDKGVHAWSFSSADTWSKGNQWTGFRIEPAPGDASRLWYYIEFSKSWTARIVSGQDYIQFRVGKDGYIGYDESQYYYTSTVSGERGMQRLVICPLQIPEAGEESVVCELVCDMDGETMPLGTLTISPCL